MAKAAHPFRRRLPYPLHVKGGPTLETVGDARQHMPALPERIALQQHWQRAAELMLDKGAALDVMARQLHLAMLLVCVLDTS